MTAARALVLAALLVIAGCSAPAGPTTVEAPTATDSATPSTDSAIPSTDSNARETDARSPTAGSASGKPATLAAEYDIAVRGGNLSIDPALVHARTVLLLGVADRTQAPESVRIRPNSEMGIGGSEAPPFDDLLGMGVPEGRDRTATALAYVAGPDAVTVNERIASRPATVEPTFAHESVHVVQFQRDTFERVAEAVAGDPAVHPDASLTATAVTEGAATYVEAAYHERYLGDRTPPDVATREAYENASDARKLAFAPYRFGEAYVDGRIDDPEALSRVYDRPPRTGEEVLHGRTEGDPLGALTVRTETDGDWIRDGEGVRQGELYVRTVLENELLWPVAADGADGWANDRRHRFENGTAAGYTWTLHWDDGDEAEEFAGAMKTYLDRRAEPTADGWRADGTAFRLLEPDEDSVVVVLGDPGFVEGVDADGEGDRVTVRVG